MVQKNIPDRIKLIIQFIVFTSGTWFVLLFIFMIVDGIFLNNASIGHKKPVAMSILALSAFLQGGRLVHKWRKLLREEASDMLPDMQDPRNITTFQTINLIIGIIILFSGVIIFQLFSKLAGIICFALLIPFWVIDKIYNDKRLAKIREANKNSDSVRST